MNINWAELIQEKNGKLSKTALAFLVWMVFLMTCIGFVTFKGNKIADLPEPYVYITVVLCGTYTARRFLDDKFGVTPKTPVAVSPVVTTLPPATATPIEIPSVVEDYTKTS